MKKLLAGLLMCFAFVAFFSSCGCTMVPPGNVGVKVYLLGGSKGVDHEVVGVGRYWLGMNESLYLFPTFQQNYTWTQSAHEGSPNDESFTFQTKEGMSVGVDVGISYAINPDKVAALFQKYRKGVDELTDVVLRNSVRDSINNLGATLTVEEAYSVKKEEFFKNVRDRVQKEFTPQGIDISNIYIIGSMRLPKEVLDSLNSKIAATQNAQKIQNEVATARAEAEKSVVKAEGEAKATMARAKAEADANRLKRESLSRELIDWELASKWNGVLPQVSGGAIPMVTLPNTSK